MTKGLILKCSDKSESECLERSLFGANAIARDEVLQVVPGDKLFLLNVDSNSLTGIFEATTKGQYNIVPGAWKGLYSYQVGIQAVEGTSVMSAAKETLNSLQLESHRLLNDTEVHALTQLFSAHGNGYQQTLPKVEESPDDILKHVIQELRQARKAKGLDRLDDERPPFESTTLWDFPKQSYGRTPKGSNKYAGVTPAFIIWNLLKRYTVPGDLVVDPMCGSGTTIDVCKEEGRRVIGYDVVSTRPDIIENDARHIPLEDDSVDLVFIDSPYGDNIKYNDSPQSIGNISAESEEFYDELEKVMQEAYRILKPGKVLGWLIGDQWVKKRFTPVGFKVYASLTKYFEPLDVISVARRSQTSNTGMWHNRARRFNFYLRGFKYLHIVRKPLLDAGKQSTDGERTVRWARYKRGK